jgi:hypothetical protein
MYIYAILCLPYCSPVRASKSCIELKRDQTWGGPWLSMQTQKMNKKGYTRNNPKKTWMGGRGDHVAWSNIQQMKQLKKIHKRQLR